MREYVRVRDLIHIVDMDSICADVCFCGIKAYHDYKTAFDGQFDPCELCCECQAYELAAQKVSP